MKLRYEIVNLHVERMWGNFHSIGPYNDLLDTALKTQTTKANTNKWNYIKLERLCTAKETTEKRDNPWISKNRVRLPYL